MGARGWEISMEQQDAHEFMQVLMSTLGEEYDHLQRKNMKVFLYTLNGNNNKPGFLQSRFYHQLVFFIFYFLDFS